MDVSNFEIMVLVYNDELLRDHIGSTHTWFYTRKQLQDGTVHNAMNSVLALGPYKDSSSPTARRCEIYTRVKIPFKRITEDNMSDLEDYYWTFLKAFNAEETLLEAQLRRYGADNLG